MWTVQALKREYQVALVAGGRIDLATLNSFYGTSIEPAECETLEIPLPWPLSRVEWGAALRGALVDRGTRDHFNRFDLLISSYNIGNFGRPGIHLLADFSWDEAFRRERGGPSARAHGLLQMKRLCRKAYLALAKSIAAAPTREIRGGLGIVLANSHWAADMLRARHGIEAAVLYPPVNIPSCDALRRRKRRRFVCIGRISPEKRIERMIEILRGVRARGHDISMHIVGDTGASAYGRRVEALARSEGEWVVLEGRQAGKSKAELLAASAFGIHALGGEAFGIAVAEMVQAGCVPFVPAIGGPAEIVGYHPALIYRDANEAIEKIHAVLTDENLLVCLREHLAVQAKRFSTQLFQQQIKQTVDSFMARTRL